MRVNTKSFPHPVLGNEDDLGGIFKPDFQYELSKDEVVLNPVFTLSNRAIEELVKKGRASFVVEVECGSTFYRGCFSSRDLANRFSLPANRVRNRVTVGFYVCADEDITGYRPSEPHPDYEDAIFDVDSGGVLAFGGYTSFIAEKNFDPLRPPVSSFMSIRPGPNHEGPAEIDYTDDKIAIVLSKSDWKHYTDVRSQKMTEGILHASVVLPALIDAIYQVRNEAEHYENANWYSRITAILEARKLEDKPAFEAAQKILEHPVDRSFKSMQALLEISDEETYE